MTKYNFVLCCMATMASAAVGADITTTSPESVSTTSPLLALILAGASIALVAALVSRIPEPLSGQPQKKPAPKSDRYFDQPSDRLFFKNNPGSPGYADKHRHQHGYQREHNGR